MSMQHCVDMGGCTFGVENRCSGSPFKNGDQRVCSNYRGNTLLSLPGKVSPRVLERRVQLLTEPRIQEEQWGICPGGSIGVFFVDLEKAYDLVPQGALSGVLREYGVAGFSVLLEPELGSHCQQ